MTKRPKKLSQDAAMRHVMETLSAFEPLSHVDYADLSGMKITGAFARICVLHGARLIHIAHWRSGKSCGTPRPYYAIGNIPDAPCPKPVTNAEKLRKCRQKIRAEGGARLEAMLQKRRSYHQKKMAEDPAYLARIKRESARYRKRKALEKLPDIRKLDPLLAAIMAPRKYHIDQECFA